jgi:hypothetical protein
VGCSDGFVDEIEVPEAVSEDQWEIVSTTLRSHWWMFGVQWCLEGLHPLDSNQTNQTNHSGGDNVGVFGELLYK